MTPESPLFIVINKASGNRDANEAEVIIWNVLEQAGIAQADAVEQGQLVALMARPVGALALLGLVGRGALGQLGDADNLVCFTFKQLAIRPHRRRRIKAAMDGEVIWLRTPLTFEIAPRPLPLLAPANSPEDVDGGSA